jgi:hypothetical protein
MLRASGKFRWNRLSATLASGGLLCCATLGAAAERETGVRAPTPNLSCSVTRVDGGGFVAPPDLEGISAGSPTDAWAVGDYGTKNLAGLATVADHWDGKRWHAVYPPTLPMAPSGLNGVSVRTATDAWAVGFGGLGTLAEHWNGSAWTIVPTPHVGDPQNINDFKGVDAFAPDAVVAVGHTGYQQSSAPLVEVWNGTTWSVIATPGPKLGGLQAVSGSSPDDVWAVGADHAGRPLVLHLNGMAWRTMPVPVPRRTKYAAFVGVLDRAPNDVWAVGGSTVDGSLYMNLIEHWNGTAWSIVPSPDAQWLQTQGIDGVSARSPNDIWAVGDGPVALHWNGSTWALVDTREEFPTQSVFAGVAMSGPQALIVGYTTVRPVRQLVAAGACR